MVRCDVGGEQLLKWLDLLQEGFWWQIENRLVSSFTCEEGEHKGEAIVLFLAENNDDQDHVNDYDDQGCTFSSQGRRL